MRQHDELLPSSCRTCFGIFRVSKMLTSRQTTRGRAVSMANLFPRHPESRSDPFGIYFGVLL